MVPGSLGPSLPPPQFTFIKPQSEPSSTLEMKLKVLWVLTRPFMSWPCLPNLSVSLCTLASADPST